MRKHVVLIIVAILIGIFAFKRSLGLSLFGDDWLHLFIFKYRILTGYLGSPTDIKTYLSPYGPTFLIMGIINNFFGYNPLPYFIFSLVSRSLVCISVYFFIFFITKNRWAGFISAVTWTVSVIGVETTNWVFNMNSYLGIALFLITLIFFIKYHETEKRLLLGWSVLFLTLSAVMVPVRMHGSFATLIILEIFYLFSKWRGIISIRKFILLTFIWSFIFFLLYNLNVFGQGNFDIYIGSGTRDSLKAFSQGRYDHLLTPFTTIGNFIFPDEYLRSIQIPRIIFKIYDLSWYKSFLIPLYLVVIPIFSVFAALIVERRKFILFVAILSILSLIFITIVNFLILTGSPNSLSPNQLFLTVIGGQTVIFTTLFGIFSPNRRIRTGVFVSLAWLLGFAAVPFLFTPMSYTTSSMRYLVTPGVFVPILFGLLLANSRGLSNRAFLSILVVPLIWIQFHSVQSYFNNLLLSRSEKISDSIWKTILTTVPVMDPMEDYMFYFDFTDGNYTIVRDVITFGFIPRMIVYDLSPDRPGALYVIEKKSEFYSALKDGEELRRINWGKPKRINIENSYAFRLGSDNTLTDIRDEILKDL